MSDAERMVPLKVLAQTTGIPWSTLRDACSRFERGDDEGLRHSILGGGKKKRHRYSCLAWYQAWVAANTPQRPPVPVKFKLPADLATLRRKHLPRLVRQ